MDYFTPLYYLVPILGGLSVALLAYAIWDYRRNQRRLRRGTPRRRGPPHLDRRSH